MQKKLFVNTLQKKKTICPQTNDFPSSPFRRSRNSYILIVSTTDIFRIFRIGPVKAAAAEAVITATMTRHSASGRTHASPHLVVITCRYRQ